MGIALLLVIILAFAGAVIFFEIKKSNGIEKENKEILNDGNSVKGKVISVEELGISGNEFYRKLKINFEVFPENGDAYPAFATVDEVKVSEIVNYAPGKEFNLRVDPNDPQKIAIEN